MQPDILELYIALMRGNNVNFASSGVKIKSALISTLEIHIGEG